MVIRADNKHQFAESVHIYYTIYILRTYALHRRMYIPITYINTLIYIQPSVALVCSTHNTNHADVNLLQATS